MPKNLWAGQGSVIHGTVRQLGSGRVTANMVGRRVGEAPDASEISWEKSWRGDHENARLPVELEGGPVRDSSGLGHSRLPEGAEEDKDTRGAEAGDPPGIQNRSEKERNGSPQTPTRNSHDTAPTSNEGSRAAQKSAKETEEEE